MMAAAFLTLGGLMLLLGALVGGAAWALAWPAVSFAAVGVAYATRRPSVFGKQPNGTLRPPHVVLLAPYLGLTWITWHIARKLTREPAWARLSDDLYVGRRPLAGELHADVRSIVDLTAEFRALRAVTAGREYLAVPILDASAPAPDEIEAITERIRALPTPVYIHCAQGHGRTATIAVATLIATGKVATVDAGLGLLHTKRPGARPNRAQRDVLERWADVRLTPAEGSA